MIPLNSLVFTGGPTSIANFRPELPYTYCRICGAVFQDNDVSLRQSWSFKHSERHSPQEHRLLALSNNWLTPEAAQVLTKYGIVSLMDLVLSEEHEDAYANSTPA